MTSALMLVSTIAIAAAVFLQFYPGALSPDSLSILGQARSGVLHDGHPPLLALVWRLADSIWPGPAPILLLHLALYYGGLYLVLRSVAAGAGLLAWICLVVVAAFPPLLGILGAIWIDVSLAALLLFALGLWMTAAGLPAGWPRRLLLAGAAVAIVAAIAVRHNGAAAALPLVALFLLDPSRRRPVSGRRLLATVAAAVGLTVLLLAATQRLSAQVVDVRQQLWRVAAVYDVAGVSFIERAYLFDPRLFPGATLADIDALYSVRSAAPLLLGRQVHALPPAEMAAAHAFDVGALDASLDPVLRDDWKRAVLDHPVAFLRHRAGIFESLVTRTRWGLWAPVFGAIYANDLGVPDRPEPGGWFFDTLRNIAFHTPLFVPAGYLVLSMLAFVPVLVLGLRSGSMPLLAAAALFASGLLHMAGLFPLIASTDFRYAHWLIASTVLATALVLVEAARRWRPH